MSGTRRVVFLDRDGTLIVEPPDEQVDSLEKLKLVPDVIPALLALRDAGYRFVIVTNQDGLGTEAFPREAYQKSADAMTEIFESQGIRFEDVLVCPHRPADGCLCRKPHLGLVRPLLTSGELDLARCAVVGDRETDLMLAANMGVRGFRVGPDLGWHHIARQLISAPRTARVERSTRETRVVVEVDLDGSGAAEIGTGLPFFDHMLDQLARHGGFDLKLHAEGDLAVEAHHTVEDTALALGEALRRALGDKIGIARYGFSLPMDEASAQATIDLSGRPYLVFRAAFDRNEIGGLPTEMFDHFYRSFSEALGAALHVSVDGRNGHHMIEATFKAVGRALRQAIARQGVGLPSTKGVL